MKLIIGLGNPGKKYENTRHNVGFLAIDKYVEKKELSKKTKMGGEYYKTNDAIFLKPQKYMNLSGKIVKKYIEYFKINIEDILVIYDDLDITFATIKLKQEGGSAGHNGIKNIIENLSSNQFKRLKIGISKQTNIDTTNYVLSQFNEKEKEELNKTIESVLNIIEDYLVIDFVDLMNKYN